MIKDTDKITVCAQCLQASCWQGIFMCDRAEDADVKEMTVAELRRLGLEHESWWDKDNPRSI